MQFLDKTGLNTFLTQLKEILGKKSIIDASRNALDTYILNVDYENNLKFNTDVIVLNNNPYVGSAIVGSTCVA